MKTKDDKEEEGKTKQLTATGMEVNKNDFGFNTVFRSDATFFHFFPKYK